MIMSECVYLLMCVGLYISPPPVCQRNLKDLEMGKENHEGFTLIIQQDGGKDDLDWTELYLKKNKDIYLQACI